MKHARNVRIKINVLTVDALNRQRLAWPASATQKAQNQETFIVQKITLLADLQPFASTSASTPKA
jgi:hypothetical protein